MSPKKYNSSAFKVRKRYVPLTKASKVTLSMLELHNLIGLRSQLVSINSKLRDQNIDFGVVNSRLYWAEKELIKVRDATDAICSHETVGQCSHSPSSTTSRNENLP